MIQTNGRMVTKARLIRNGNRWSVLRQTAWQSDQIAWGSYGTHNAFVWQFAHKAEAIAKMNELRGHKNG